MGWLKFIHGFSTVWALNPSCSLINCTYSLLKMCLWKHNMNFVFILKKMCTKVMLFVSLFQPQFNVPECRKACSSAWFNPHDLEGILPLPFHRLTTQAQREGTSPRSKITHAKFLTKPSDPSWLPLHFKLTTTEKHLLNSSHLSWIS